MAKRVITCLVISLPDPQPVACGSKRKSEISYFLVDLIDYSVICENNFYIKAFYPLVRALVLKSAQPLWKAALSHVHANSLAFSL